MILLYFSQLFPSIPPVTVSARADSVIWLKAGHMALYLVRRSLCVAAHSFHPASKPLRNAELSDSDWVCKVCMCVELGIVFQLVCQLHFSLCIWCSWAIDYGFIKFTVDDSPLSLNWGLKIAQIYRLYTLLLIYIETSSYWSVTYKAFFLARKQHCCSDCWPSESYRIMFLSHTW